MWAKIKWLFRALVKVLNVIRVLITTLLLLIIVSFGFILFGSDENTQPLPDKAALTLALSGPLLEQEAQASPKRMAEKWLSGDNTPPPMTLSQIKTALDMARTDDRIQVLVLQLQNMTESSITKLDEVGTAIEQFKTSGKTVYAIGDYYSQGQYYLAAHADEILLNPAGGVSIQGLGVYRLHYKSAFERFNITPHVFRVGTYKSFVEPYIRDDMSEESREDTQLWLGQLWQHYQDTIAKLRNIPTDHISPTKEQMLSRFAKVNGDPAQYALEQGLVDRLATRSDMLQTVAEQVGWNSQTNQYMSLDVATYLARTQAAIKPTANTIPAVGIITASGAIMSADTATPNSINDEHLTQLINEARLDDQIKALVLRVDSPGGSAFAAEQIRSSLLNFKASGKPLVISMGSTAASGGYWIAADADKIYASPTTLTGSIGVFGLFLTFEEALQKVGLNTDGVGTTDFVGAGITTGLPDHVKDMIQMSVEHTYGQFVSIVAKGRDMQPAQVERVAQGHVWTGQMALELGLVDELGNIDDALVGAALLANLGEFDVKPVKLPMSAKDKLLAQFMGDSTVLSDIAMAALPQALRPAALLVQQEVSSLGQFSDVRGQYVLCVPCQGF
ncbi:signal peptide peptidase SppA [Oceanisphaera profunda]|uniref:Signal peptide peptidase SppA n=1 Tax=Oceanisphaera profunda TaxID=1416627 RepID=A0A1Y0D819_9GAMM|nr:signal peptide peptidase SppA [Oceanisphaera profunda]ART83698.1 signal peptide peptidase SppA [Oceanisphaera profunda]